MRKDISIPKVEDVHVVAVLEFNKEHNTNDWNVYIINDRQEAIEMVLILSRGYGKNQETSQMRHKLQVLPAQSFAKIEFLEDSVLKLNNEFLVTFFADNQLMEKTYVFKANNVKENNVTAIPVMKDKGILAE
tara:strand:- start:62 stop:457 length:396 start_codon:yes stop_codon:yes gene_type:complete